jgi:HEAT repeat protein
MDRLTRDIFRKNSCKNHLAAASAAAISPRPSVADIFRITQLLRNRDPMIRRGAIDILANIRGKDTTDAITHCLKDTCPQVRAAACHALGRMRAQSAKNALYDAIHDSDTSVAINAIEALALMGDRFGLDQIKILVARPGSHQRKALQCLNMLTNSKFHLNEQGLQKAIQWVRPARKKILAI